MNAYERVFNRLEGKNVDRIPNLNIIMTFAAKYIGVPYKKYVTDYRSLVEGNIRCCEAFGIDMVSAISDPFREAHDFGADIFFPEDDVPICKVPLIREYSYIKLLKVRNPLQSERMLDRIKAVELYKHQVNKVYPILGWVEGALAEAADLRGVNQLMIDFFSEPEFIHELLEISTQQSIYFATEQVKAGADFIGVGDAVASLIGPSLYKEFALTYEKRICDAIHHAGAKVKLHICGNITSILNLVPLSGADMIDIDWMVDFKRAVDEFHGKCSACGNFDPVEVLLHGDVQDVTSAVRKCVESGDDTTFIAAGCEVPKNTAYDNLKAVAASL